MRAFSVVSAVLLAVVPMQAAEGERDITPVRLAKPPQADEEGLPLVYWQERLTNPVPVMLSIMRVDLRSSRVEVAAVMADDPDGTGPAESQLTLPLELAASNNLLAAVNANAFSALPDADGKRSQRYIPGMPVDILGFAASDGVRRSGPFQPAPQNDLCFWLDSGGKPHIGKVPDESSPVKQAVNAWWGDLVADGKVLPKPGGDRHPRTAVGCDADGRWLYLVVADGRQTGYSEGMDLRELADTMSRLGAAYAINLDGGGSSMMLVAEEKGKRVIVNRPSSGAPRPVPVLLGVRVKK